MNDFEAKWSKLSAVGHSGGRLRVYPDHLLDFFLDFSLSGRREVIIEAKGVDYDLTDLPSFENLEVAYTKFPNGVRIGLTLTFDQLIKSFAVMCFDLAERSKSAESINSALGIVIECLRNWAELFKRRGNIGLTRNEAIGLLGELTVLEKLLADMSGNEVLIIQGWRGPNNDQRDIGFNSTRIEVKTQLSTQAICLRISSIDQLDERGDRIKVALNRISPSDSGLSLADMVQRLSHLLQRENLALSEFERKMELSGYMPDFAVSKEKFGLDEQILYTVSDDFPRLIPGNVPLGIKAVQYEISGPVLSHFRIEWKDLMESLNEQS
jgi:hypothetical protein